MVEDNENKKRKGLFGGRRTSRRASAAASNTPEVASAPQPVRTDVAPARDASTTATQTSAVTTRNEPADSTSAFEAAPQTPAEQDTNVDLTTPPVEQAEVRRPSTSLLFQAPNIVPLPARTGARQTTARQDNQRQDQDDDGDEASTVRRRARRRTGDEGRSGSDDPANTVVRVRTPREPELITNPSESRAPPVSKPRNSVAATAGMPVAAAP